MDKLRSQASEKANLSSPATDGGNKGQGDVQELECGKGGKWYQGEIPVPPPVPKPAMAPPTYSDLGKKAKDVFNRGYHFGLIKLDCKTKTGAGVEFSTGGVSNQEAGTVFGSLETKYKVKEYGLTFTEKWNTDNQLGTEIAIQDYLAQGLKLSCDVNFSPQSGDKSGRAKIQYLHEKVAINADADVKSDAPIVSGSAVVGHQGWLAGYQAAFDVNNSKLTKNNFALGFATNDFILHTTVESKEAEGEGDDATPGGTIFGALFYQRISPKMETSYMIEWPKEGEEGKKLGAGCRYQLDQDAVVCAKIDNDLQIGLSYQQKLREGITMILSCKGDCKEKSKHQIGLALLFEP